MDITSIKNGSIYGTQSGTDDKKPVKKQSDPPASNNMPVDILELSEEAKLSRLLDHDVIKDRIRSGFYENPEVLRDVAVRLSREIPVEAKE